MNRQQQENPDKQNIIYLAKEYGEFLSYSAKAEDLYIKLRNNCYTIVDCSNVKLMSGAFLRTLILNILHDFKCVEDAVKFIGLSDHDKERINDIVEKKEKYGIGLTAYVTSQSSKRETDSSARMAD